MSVINSTDLKESAQNFLAFVDSRKDKYSFAELRLELGELRGCPSPLLPRTTLLNWLKQFDFPVRKDGYSVYHRKKLAGLAAYLRVHESRGKRGTVKGFERLWCEYEDYLRKQKEPKNETQRVARTVEAGYK